MPERDTNAESVQKAAETAVIEGNLSRLEELLRQHPELLTEMSEPYLPQGPGPNYENGAARSIIAREHHFQNFDEFAAHRELIKDPNHPAAQFEQAIEAVINGNLATLKGLLRANPELIHMRSPRTHHSTLLHYVGANGIEGWRQKSPKNSVEVAEILVKAGAQIDVEAGMYGGGCTTLELVATSIHPWLAGVVEPLMDFLLKNGARMDGPKLINACHANGRPRAAQFLARRGAPLDLEGAAGVGRLDLVRTYFAEDGTLKNATETQMCDAFAWACEYGHTDVAEFLLNKGVPIDAKLRNHNQTGLHWAAHGAHLSLVKLLLDRGAPVNTKDPSFNGTPLGWALHGWSEGVPETPSDRYYEVVSLLVRSGATVEDQLPTGNFGEKLRADPRMLEALRKT